METEKKKRGRPPKPKFTELSGMTYEGAISIVLTADYSGDRLCLFLYNEKVMD